jgi:DNA invertase Pin-like site-specific DNA recombinase
MAKDNKKLEIEKLKSEVEQLKSELKKKKKYGLVWEEKPEEVVEMCKEKLPELLSITKVARMLGVSTMTLRRWDTKGILKSFRPTPSS